MYQLKIKSSFFIQIMAGFEFSLLFLSDYLFYVYLVINCAMISYILAFLQLFLKIKKKYYPVNTIFEFILFLINSSNRQGYIISII
jgi:hypothetical protein